MRKQYIVIKDTPELKIGAVLEEMCDAGNQGFRLTTTEFLKFPKDKTAGGSIQHARHVVMKQPQYFMEITMIPVPKNKIEAVNKILKK